SVGLIRITIYAASALVTALLFNVVTLSPQQQAYGDILVFLDGNTCEPDFNGIWNTTTNTCTLYPGLVLTADKDVEVSSGVTVILPGNVTSIIGDGRTLFIASGGSLNIQGRISNHGSLINSGTLTVDNADQNNLGIFSNGTIANSGTLAVSNTDISSVGIVNNGIITNSGTLAVSNGGESSFGIQNPGTITNSGTLAVSNTDISSVGIDNFGSLATLTNTGSLTVSNSGGVFGHPVTGIANSGTLTNSGTLAVSNSGQYSQGILNIGIIFSFPFFTNSGTITLSNNGGIGLYNFGSSSTVTNSGNMTVSNNGGIGLYNSVGSGGIANSNSGTITLSNNGGIGLYNFGSSSNFNNTGTVAVSNIGSNSFGIFSNGTIYNPGIINNYCGTILNAGNFIGNPINDLCDSDNDRISDNVDIQPNTFSNDFADTGIGGNTTGTIITRGNQTVTIFDAPNPAGIEIKTEPGSGDAAEITACGGSALYTLSAGTDIIVTCGSVTTQVVQGPAQVDFIGDDGSTASTTIETGLTLTFYPDTFSFSADPRNLGPISIIMGGSTVTVDAGETVQRFPVIIDIKPGGTPNSINIKKEKIMTVAILGSSTFSVDSVDKSSLRFGGHSPQLASKMSLQDVNKDSLMDLVLQYKVPALGFSASDTQGCLTGLLQSGIPIIGCDNVRILDK
ncbi:MAG TPA: hypothetical protein VD736_08150, partial [Nitrososphaera sp.]|nr:hypothetical protein [Nitrososphaera sp.]